MPRKANTGWFLRNLRRALLRMPPLVVAVLWLALGTAATVRVASWARATAHSHTSRSPAAEGLLPEHAALIGGALVTLALAAVSGFGVAAHRRASRLVQDVSESLHHKHSRTRAMADTAADAIVVVDEERRIRWVNRSAAAIFGYPGDTLASLVVPQILPAFMGQQIATWLTRHGDGQQAISIDTLGVHADATVFPVTLSVSRFKVPGELLYTCIIRATANAKWAASELMLRERALASSTNGITIADMKREGGPLIYVNPAFEDITGYGAQEALGRSAGFLQRADTDQAAVAALRQAISENRSCHVVLRNYRKDGSMFWNDLSIAPVQQADGQVTHYVGIQVDITERIRAEAALQLRTERLNAVFDLSPDGFVALDEHGVVTIVNPAFERMTGLHAAQLVGRSIERFEQSLGALCAAPDHPEEETRRFIDTQPPDAEGSPDPRLPPHGFLHLRAPGERTLLRRTRRARDRGKETVMYFRDITRELEVDRMKSEFLSTAAHELRTPMSSIYGFAELLLKRSYDAGHQREMLSTIHRQAGVLINLINELLDLARIESRRGKDFRFEPQPLQGIVEATLAGLLVHNDARQVCTRMPAGPILVNVDAEKLSLSLTNILSNAYKYSPNGGEISLEIVWRDQEGQRFVGLSVRDRGIGMTPHQLYRMFDRFYRADASGSIPGTGLGMAIVKEIAELHGGCVTAISEAGRGTTVVMWLPALSPDMVPTEPAALDEPLWLPP